MTDTELDTPSGPSAGPSADTSVKPSKRPFPRSLPAAMALCALSVWGIWAFGVQRAVRYPFGSHAHSNVFTVSSLALWLTAISMTAVFAKRRALRFIAIPAVASAAVAPISLSSVVASWDLAAYIFLAVSCAAVLLAIFKAPVVRVPLRLMAPVAGVLLVAVTQVAAPNVPERAFKSYDRLSVAQQAGCPDIETEYSPSAGRMMMPTSSCHKLAIDVLAATAEDGCYTAREAYALLGMLQGPNVENPEAASVSAQVYLTGAWLRGKDHMESGFCAKTINKVRTFSRPDGTVLFTASSDRCLLDYSRDPFKNSPGLLVDGEEAC